MTTGGMAATGSARDAARTTAAIRTATETDEEIMEMANMSARTYVTHYMRKIRRARLNDTDGG